MSTHLCGEWVVSSIEAGKELTQKCDSDYIYENKIMINNEGYISKIHQIVDNSYTPITLIKLN